MNNMIEVKKRKSYKQPFIKLTGECTEYLQHLDIGDAVELYVSRKYLDVIDIDVRKKIT